MAESVQITKDESFLEKLADILNPMGEFILAGQILPILMLTCLSNSLKQMDTHW